MGIGTFIAFTAVSHPFPMRLRQTNHQKTSGFSFAEVCVAIVVCVIFGAAAFGTNQRLLIVLKDQKEETAATMMLQERMEEFRSFSYSNVANKDYVKNNILKSPTTSEAALGNLTEYVTVSGYTPTSGYTPNPATDYNQWVRNPQHTDGQEMDHNDNLATNYDLLKVDVVVSWTAANGRVRTRELAEIFGKGNIGQ
jgi:type II secretory pathway pseudopilin PulG